MVADGYDAIASRFAVWTLRNAAPALPTYLDQLEARLPDRATVLDLGCGAGELATRILAQRFHVTAVDISGNQLALARRHVPAAVFIQADMTALALPPQSFDAVVALYSITHVPRIEHARLLASIAGWLRPGGLLLATLGAGETPDVLEADWLGMGATMFFSHFNADANRALVRQAGFELLHAEVLVQHEDGRPVRFLWVLAKRNASG